MAGRRTRFVARFSERRGAAAVPLPGMGWSRCLTAKPKMKTPTPTMSDPIAVRRRLLTHETESS